MCQFYKLKLTIKKSSSHAWLPLTKDSSGQTDLLTLEHFVSWQCFCFFFFLHSQYRLKLNKQCRYTRKHRICFAISTSPLPDLNTKSSSWNISFKSKLVATTSNTHNILRRRQFYIREGDVRKRLFLAQFLKYLELSLCLYFTPPFAVHLQHFHFTKLHEKVKEKVLRAWEEKDS